MALAKVLGFNDLVASRPAVGEVDEDRKVRLGMLFYVLTDLILAVFFFASYVFLRGYNTNGRWDPPPVAGVIGHGPVGATAVITVIAIVGALAYGVGQWALHADRYALFTAAMVTALVLYAVDMVAQVVTLLSQRYDVSSGSFASSFDVLAGYHVYHMLLAMFLGIGIVHRASRGLYKRRAEVSSPDAHTGHDSAPHSAPPERTAGIASIGYYWHYAAIYSIGMWLLLVLLPPR